MELRRVIITSFDRWLGRLTSGFLWIAGAGLITMALLVTSNSMLRWLFRGGIHFAHELNMMLFVGVALLSFAYVLRAGAHIRIPLIFDRLPKEVKPWAQFVSDTIMLVLVVIISIGSVIFVVDSHRLMSATFLIGIPLWIPQLVIPIGFILLTLEVLVKILKKQQDL